MINSIKRLFGKAGSKRDLDEGYMHYEDFMYPNIDDKY